MEDAGLPPLSAGADIVSVIQNSEVLIDFRDEGDFVSRHARNSTWIPWELRKERSAELPPRHRSLSAIIPDTVTIEMIADFFASYQYLLSKLFVWDAELERILLLNDNLIENSAQTRRVWEPSPCLAGVIDRIEAMRLESGLPPTGTVIDIGCGSGRDIIFLAQRGWKAIGVDNNPDYLAKAQLLAKRYGTSIDVKLLDVETHSAALAAVTDQVDLLNVARYLDRALMPVLRDIISPYGFVVYHQFMVGCAKPKRPRYLLNPGELASIHFIGFTIVEDRVFLLEDGRPTSWFLARKA